MLMQRRHPLGEMRHMNDAMDRMWRRFGAWPHWDHAGSNRFNGHDGWAAPLDVFTDGDSFFVRASLPGVTPEDIEVSLEDNVLTISGHTASQFENAEGSYFMRERRSGSFQRSVRLPDTINPELLEPRYEHGVLTITLPRAEATKSREFPVQVVEGPALPDAS